MNPYTHIIIIIIINIIIIIIIIPALKHQVTMYEGVAV